MFYTLVIGFSAALNPGYYAVVKLDYYVVPLIGYSAKSFVAQYSSQ